MHTPTTLPPELLSAILAHALASHPRPADVLATHPAFLAAGRPLLYRALRFASEAQLARFAAAPGRVPVRPRSVELVLAGGAAAFDVFGHLAGVFRRCIASGGDGDARAGVGEDEGEGGLELDSLALCLNSHAGSPHLQQVYQALRLVNPRRFSWLGPDPSHHFSIAIVPEAVTHLFGAMRAWTRAAHITLTNIAFPSELAPSFTTLDPAPLALPPLPALRSLYLGQATRLPPALVAALLLGGAHAALERVRVVDAYAVSIWGPRVRRRDIEAAALALALRLEVPADVEDVRERVRAVVRCEALTERIVGGDRVVDGVGVLE